MGCTCEIKFSTFLYPESGDIYAILSWLASTLSNLAEQVRNVCYPDV